MYNIFLVILLSLLLYAKDTTSSLMLGYSSATLDQNGNGYNLGYGINKFKSNSIYWGILFNYESIKIDNSSISGFSGDLQLGYTLLDKFSIYTIGSALTQNIESINGVGFGYGVGINYKINNLYSISCYHKIYNMTSKYNEYDYKTSSINLKYHF